MNFATEKEFMFTHLIQQKLIKEKSKYENKVALLELLENNINKMPSLISVQKNNFSSPLLPLVYGYMLMIESLVTLYVL